MMLIYLVKVLNIFACGVKFVVDLIRNIVMRTRSSTNQELNVRNSPSTSKKSRNILMSNISDLVERFNSIALQEGSYPELTAEQEEEIEKALHGGPNTDTIITRFHLIITRADLSTLAGDNRLNDQIINFYLNLLVERNATDPHLPRLYAMNTFFVPKLLSSGHAALRRWTRKVDLFAHDLILVPVHIAGLDHWCMAIVDLGQHTIRYYDSLGGGRPNHQVMDALERYLREESLDKRGKPLERPDYEKRHMRECPRQEYSNDCGVFSCAFAEHEARKVAVKGFGQAQMAYFRRKMVYEISKGRLLT
ncbi:sentrin-specific protease-like [Culex quinquefasciatus]|uniref:Sentrin-specific protease n=1 Tax=Culex pipiens TaxID=7175 RepID=A0A8D8H5B3_CULPI|nr:sentrin-specific protease-like [Culex quinquefasciatus]